MPGPEITAPWLGPRPAPESRTFHEGATNPSAGAGDASRRNRSALLGLRALVQGAWGTQLQLEGGRASAHLAIVSGPSGRNSIRSEMHRAAASLPLQVLPTGNLFRGLSGTTESCSSCVHCRASDLPRVSFQLLLQ